uniref:Uncharacterized protein n=1 Tax=Knipowitschia caucasica TaxID=637954 RepID=A0AAV2KXK2_KNICA
MNWTHGIILACSLVGIAKAWTYHYSNVTMNWAQARDWCQTKFTDMVVIQNQQENDYLVSVLPQRNSSPYFWIGITKTYSNETWRWIGDNSTWMSDQSWAENEPNNNRSTEFCVEIYTSRGRNRGKWNDEKCSMAKYVSCYKAQCTNTTCDRGECHEVINNVTCHCQAGFEGERCQTAVACALGPGPDDGDLICSRNHTVNSTCHVSCSWGLFTIASGPITCESDGLWSGPRPACAVGSGAVSTLCCLCFCWRQYRKRQKNSQERPPDEDANSSSALSG